MVTEHVLKTFGLTERDGTQLGHIALNLRDIFSAGTSTICCRPACCDASPAGPMSRTAVGPGRRLGGLQKVATELDQQHSAKVEAARQQLHAENARRLRP